MALREHIDMKIMQQLITTALTTNKNHEWQTNKEESFHWPKDKKSLGLGPSPCSKCNLVVVVILKFENKFFN